MEYEFGGSLMLEQELVENRLGKKLRILIEGPQGSGKSSLAKYFGDCLGFYHSRGFPSGEFIKKSGDQVEICTKSIDQISRDFDEDGAVFDRSPISQFVWMIKEGNGFEEVFSNAKVVLEGIAYKDPLTVIFIRASVDACVRRQDSSGLLAVDRDDLVKEVEIYQRFFERLSRENIPGMKCYMIDNRDDMSEHDFLDCGFTFLKEKLLINR